MREYRKRKAGCTDFSYSLILAFYVRYSEFFKKCAKLSYQPKHTISLVANFSLLFRFPPQGSSYLFPFRTAIKTPNSFSSRFLVYDFRQSFKTFKYKYQNLKTHPFVNNLNVNFNSIFIRIHILLSGTRQF